MENTEKKLPMNEIEMLKNDEMMSIRGGRNDQFCEEAKTDEGGGGGCGCGCGC